MSKIIFHGGCVGCVQQDKHGVSYCTNCQYFEPDWSKPDLSIREDSDKNQVIKVAKFLETYKKRSYWLIYALLIALILVLIFK